MIFSTSFGRLQANLSEIYTAIHSPHNQDTLPLYAASSSIVYFEESFIGRAVKLWDRFCRWIQVTQPFFSAEKALLVILTTLFDHAVHMAYDSRLRRICNHMRQIDKIYKNQDVTGQSQRYFQFLEEELQGSAEANNPIYLEDFRKRKKTLFTIDEERHHRHLIVKFYQATSVFWSLFLKNTEENIALRAPLMRFLNPSSTLANLALFKALKKEMQWVQIEGITQQPIPVALLAKLENPTQLTVKENKCLKSWVQALNLCQDSISPRSLLSVLNEVISVIRLQGSSAIHLSDLLDWLDQQGCVLLHQEDPLHMNWREGLQPGDCVMCNGCKLVLGNQKSADKLVDDTYKVFELTSHPSSVLKIADNRFRLLIENKRSQREKNRSQSDEEHWGVRFVETALNLGKDQEHFISGLDQEGRCVVMEKLSYSLDNYVWKSQSIELIPEDEDLALSLANHFFWMRQWKYSPQNFSLAHLMRNQEGVLKSLHLLKKKPFNYDEVESYCEEVSHQNRYVLQFLMEVSKLKEHEIAIYYRDIVECTVRTGKISLVGKPLPLGYREQCYEQHAKELCEAAKRLRADCMKHVIAHLRRKKQYVLREKKALEARVVEKIIELYRLWPTPGRLSNLREEVVNSFFASRKSSEEVFDSSKYYQEKYELMMAYNTISHK